MKVEVRSSRRLKLCSPAWGFEIADFDSLRPVPKGREACGEAGQGHVQAQDGSDPVRPW